MLELLGFARPLGRVMCCISDAKNFQDGMPRFLPSACEIGKLFPNDQEAVAMAANVCRCRAEGDGFMWNILLAKGRVKFVGSLAAMRARRRYSL